MNAVHVMSVLTGAVTIAGISFITLCLMTYTPPKPPAPKRRPLFNRGWVKPVFGKRVR
jgi:hypothetical protein